LKFPVVLIGCMRCSPSDERQVADLPDVLLAAGVDGRRLHKHKGQKARGPPLAEHKGTSKNCPF